MTRERHLENMMLLHYYFTHRFSIWSVASYEFEDDEAERMFLQDLTGSSYKGAEDLKSELEGFDEKTSPLVFRRKTNLSYATHSETAMKSN